jgi:Domain of unknown function (DUF4252)
MNPRTIINACVLLAVFVPSAALAQGARLQLGHLDRLSEKAEETVDVAVDAAMLKESAGFLAGKCSDTTKLHQVLQGITGIYVKSFEFDAPNAYTMADVDAVRKQLAAPGWSRIVGIREKNELTEIYLWKDGDTNGGLAVISAEPNELTIVNIVGRVDLGSLGALGPMIPNIPGVMRRPIPR